MGGFILLTVLWVAMGTEEGPGDVQPPHGGVIRGAGPTLYGPWTGPGGPLPAECSPSPSKGERVKKDLYCTSYFKQSQQFYNGADLYVL